jgi:hypothetical protein
VIAAAAIARRCVGVLVIAAAAAAALFAVEATSRALDGFRVLSVTLRASAPRASTAGQNSPDRQYAKAFPRVSSVKASWYEQRPEPISRIPLTPELQHRADVYPTEPWSPFFEWNLTYLREQACASVRDVVMGNLRDFYYFESLDGSRYPTYRHMRRISPPGWFVTNSFGWRGPDLVLNKPPATIRIAFVGASTTIDAFGVPFSHTELVGNWLNWWAASRGLRYRFEVINAGRMGINSNSIAAIVEQELVPVEPDLVVYYEGANQFWPNQMVKVDDTRVYEQPKMTYVKRTALEDYFDLVRRALTLLDRVQARGGYEPRKPASRVMWPDGVSETDPDVQSPKLPMDLPNIVACLDKIRRALAPIHAELVLSSFVWIVHEGMRVEVDRDLTLFNYLNHVYWPYTYAEMRRLADFQNRVFEKYAQAHNVPFIDMASDFPQDPALAADAIHFRYEGLSLQAWIYLQRLVPLIEARIADGRLPRAAQSVRAAHPAFLDSTLHRTTLEELRAQCH